MDSFRRFGKLHSTTSEGAALAAGTTSGRASAGACCNSVGTECGAEHTAPFPACEINGGEVNGDEVHGEGVNDDEVTGEIKGGAGLLGGRNGCEWTVPINADSTVGFEPKCGLCVTSITSLAVPWVEDTTIEEVCAELPLSVVHEANCCVTASGAATRDNPGFVHEEVDSVVCRFNGPSESSVVGATFCDDAVPNVKLDGVDGAL